MTGIEPAYSAWEADTLPLSYIRALRTTYYNTIFSKSQPANEKKLVFLTCGFDTANGGACIFCGCKYGKGLDKKGNNGYNNRCFAGVAELADALVLGTSR